MDRLNRLVLGGGLGLLLAASGCRTPRSEVPAGPPLVKDPTAATTPVGFGSDPAQTAMPPSMGQPNMANGLGVAPSSPNFDGSSTNYLNGGVPGGAQPPAGMNSIDPATAGNQMVTPPRPSLAPAVEPSPAASASEEMAPIDGGK